MKAYDSCKVHVSINGNRFLCVASLQIDCIASSQALPHERFPLNALENVLPVGVCECVTDMGSVIVSCLMRWWIQGNLSWPRVWRSQLSIDPWSRIRTTMAENSGWFVCGCLWLALWQTTIIHRCIHTHTQFFDLHMTHIYSHLYSSETFFIRDMFYHRPNRDPHYHPQPGHEGNGIRSWVAESVSLFKIKMHFLLCCTIRSLALHGIWSSVV